MSIPVAAYMHPVVKPAMDEAQRIIETWMEHGIEHGTTSEQIDRVCGGWSAVCLTESIAYALVEAAGYDMDTICEEAEDWRPRETMSDEFGRVARVKS